MVSVSQRIGFVAAGIGAETSRTNKTASLTAVLFVQEVYAVIPTVTNP